MTDNATVHLSRRTESGNESQKTVFIHALEAFLADPAARRLDIGYGSPWELTVAACFFAALVVPFAVVFLPFFRRVRVVVDRGARAVRVQRSRTPRGPSEDLYAIDELLGAVVESEPSPRGAPSYRVALVLTKDGSHVPLTKVYSVFRGRNERAAQAITRALLRDA